MPTSDPTGDALAHAITARIVRDLFGVDLPIGTVRLDDLLPEVDPDAPFSDRLIAEHVRFNLVVMRDTIDALRRDGTLL